jgi:hypothetical protein
MPTRSLHPHELEVQLVFGVGLDTVRVKRVQRTKTRMNRQTCRAIVRCNSLARYSTASGE